MKRNFVLEEDYLVANDLFGTTEGLSVFVAENGYYDEFCLPVAVKESIKERFLEKSLSMH